MEKITPLSSFGVDEKYLAHTPDETLCEHSELTLVYLKKIINAKSLDGILDNIINDIFQQEKELVKEIFFNAIYLHDIGKINPNFQAKKMNNPHFEEHFYSTQSSDHSLLSSDYFINFYLEKIKDKSRAIKEKLKFILYSFSYHIAKHHGSLSKFEEYRKNEKNPTAYWEYLEKFNIPEFEFFILNKLLFSLLVSSDYYATNEYMAKLKIDNFGLLSQRDKQTISDKFNDFISSFSNNNGINKLRNDIFKEAERSLLLNIDKNIFYLEAPTGSGKTITSINLALKILQSDCKIDKLFYIFPFNTLVEQTKTVFDNIFEESLKIEVINSITPIDVDEKSQEDEESKYKKSYINRLFFHSPAIITTHVAFFNILFGTSKEDNFALWQLANSVIILDEIQSYNNHLWWYMVKFFEKYAKVLNIKIVIMSATLPKLDFFLEEKNSFIQLIPKDKKEQLFKHEIFKDRVKIDYSLLDKKIELQELLKELQEIPKDKKILCEFIKKQSAREFYNLAKEKLDNVYELSGDDNKAYRQFVIEKSKNEPLVIIATQVIEAGVDIDMDVGFKDISTIDSEEQFMGRINRSCRKDGVVYFFNYDDVEKIYRNDYRLGLDLKQDKYREILQNKNFDQYYQEVLENIKKQGDKFQSGSMSNYENFSGLIKRLNYREIAKTMKLINSQNLTLFFPFQIDIQNFKGVKEFKDLEEIFLTDKKLDGQKVWNEFLSLNKIDSFSKKEVVKSKINSLMQFFTFNIFKNYASQRPHIGEEIGGYYFIENLDYITSEGKFDREKFNSDKNSVFL